MGFEVTYKYYEKTDEGYDVENVHEMKKKVGKAYDDTPYEKLAASIMGQFARRDVMVTDVAITEFVKKEISFRETKNGICIKNKKYLFDGTEMEIQAEPEVPTVMPPVMPHNVQQQVAPVPTATPIEVPPVQTPMKSKPLRWEIFEPHQDLMADLQRRGLKFTRGNKYPIYEEKQDRRGIMYGMLYVTTDDEGNKQVLTDKLFIFKQDLVGGSQFEASSGSIDLDYGPGLQADPSIPALR